MESKSTLVNVIAWIFIIGAGFASVISVVQIIMFSIMFGGDELHSMPEDAPAMAKFMTEFFHLVIYGFFVLALCTLVSSIALLKRKNWARLVFIGVLSIGILWQMGGVAMQFVIFSDLPSSSQNEGFENFELMSNIIRLFSFAIAIVVSGLFVWIIKKLATQPIIGEFVSSKSNKTTP